MVHMHDSDFQEQLHVLDDPVSGLKGVIAIHSTALGPAAGGCRLWSYPSQEELATDAIRLAKGMSYKNALAGLPFGGGKAVLQRPQGEFDRQALFRAFGSRVAQLKGRYVTAEDVGTTIADMVAVRDRTGFVAGLEAKGRAAGGDPSPWTALGIFESMKAAAEGMLDMALNEATVAVQGAGQVGSELCRLLRGEGARVLIADLDEAKAARIAGETGARVIALDEVLEAEVDVLAPCALGGVFDDATIPRLNARLICGGANNQLAREEHGDALHRRGIVYAPDYVVNAGGIINVTAEYLGESSSRVKTRIRAIAPRLLAILQDARARDEAPNRVANDLARRTIGLARRRIA